MDAKLYFKETQTFIHEWMPLFLLMFICTCIFLYGVIKQVIFGLPFGIKPAGNTALVVCLGLCLLLTLPFVFIRLETRIKEDGIYVKFFPFHLSYKKYVWSEISKSYVKKYDPMNFGIGGYLGVTRYRYVVSGNMGLQLEFLSGRRLLIGTNKPEALTEALNLIGTLKTLQHNN